jgi:hypothetical protein
MSIFIMSRRSIYFLLGTFVLLAPTSLWANLLLSQDKIKEIQSLLQREEYFKTFIPQELSEGTSSALWVYYHTKALEEKKQVEVNLQRLAVDRKLTELSEIISSTRRLKIDPQLRQVEKSGMGTFKSLLSEKGLQEARTRVELYLNEVGVEQEFRRLFPEGDPSTPEGEKRSRVFEALMNEITKAVYIEEQFPDFIELSKLKNEVSNHKHLLESIPGVTRMSEAELRRMEGQRAIPEGDYTDTIPKDHRDLVLD